MISLDEAWPNSKVLIPEGAPKEEWLRARRALITASDSAALIDAHPFLTKEELFARKLYGESFVANDRMWFGQMREEANIAIFGALTGREAVRTSALYVHPGHSLAGATPDGLLLGVAERPPLPPSSIRISLPDYCVPGTVLEAKNVASKYRSYWKRPRDSWTPKDRLFHYWCQVQWQLLVLGEEVGVLFACVDAAECYPHIIEANASYQSRMLEEGHNLQRRLAAERF